MLMDMKARTEATRAIAYYVAGLHGPCEEPYRRERAPGQPEPSGTAHPGGQRLVTETAQSVTWNGIQVHWRDGLHEETGACQHMRDARITTIYEGTTAIQANDLIGRKVAREGGHAMRALLEEMTATRDALTGHSDAHLKKIGGGARQGIDTLGEATDWLLTN